VSTLFSPLIPVGRGGTVGPSSEVVQAIDRTNSIVTPISKYVRAVTSPRDPKINGIFTNNVMLSRVPSNGTP
jgi:hypothetical protein